MKRISLLSVLLVLPVIALAAKPQASSQDRTCLAAAHQSNLAEISSGNLAAEKGRTDAVRKAGRMLTRDHTMLDSKLRPVAKKLGVKLPSKPNAEQQQEGKEFKSLTGTQFDQTWTQTEADGHVKAIEVTEREIQDGSAAQVKQLAQSALPVLKEHLNTLQQQTTTETSGVH
jgi:putative membrane protein